MKKFVDLGKGPFILEINTYYPETIDGARLLKSCKHKKFDDLKSLQKYSRKAERYDPNVRCRTFIDITDLKEQTSMDL